MVIVVDIKVFFILSTCLKTFKSCGLVVNDRVDGKGNHEDETMEFRDIMITSVHWSSTPPCWRSPPTSSTFLFIQLYDVMS